MARESSANAAFSGAKRNSPAAQLCASSSASRCTELIDSVLIRAKQSAKALAVAAQIRFARIVAGEPEARAIRTPSDGAGLGNSMRRRGGNWFSGLHNSPSGLFVLYEFIKGCFCFTMLSTSRTRVPVSRCRRPAIPRWGHRRCEPRLFQPVRRSLRIRLVRCSCAARDRQEPTLVDPEYDQTWRDSLP